MNSISVVTPVYNDPRLKRSIESVLEQRDTPPVELIVVDGESDDETVDVIESHRKNIDVLIREKDNGIYDAMNKGIQAAEGDLVGILNADDRYADPNVLRDVVEQVEATGAAACYGDLVYVDGADNIVRYWQSGEFSRKRMRLGWMPPHPTLFLRREIYESYGCFDTSFEIAADYDLILRLLLNGDVDTTYIDRVLVRMATGGKSNESLRNILKSNYEVYRSWNKNDLSGGLLTAIIKPISKLPQFVSRR